MLSLRFAIVGLIAVVGPSLVLAQLPSNPVPFLPDQFQVNIEANILRQNITLNLRQYFDHTNQRQRYEINRLDGSQWIIVDMKKNSYYVITNGTTCSGVQFYTPSLFSFAPPYLPDGYSGIDGLRDPRILSNDTYIGQSSVRGVMCDGWNTHFEFDNNFTTPGVIWHHVIDMTFYYTPNAWSFQFSNASQDIHKPVRAVLTSTRSIPGQAPSVVQNYYDFVNFLPLAPADALFDVPSICHPLQQQVLNILYTQTGAGLAAGMFFLGLFIGILIIGIAWVAGYRRRMAIERRARERANDGVDFSRK